MVFTFAAGFQTKVKNEVPLQRGNCPYTAIFVSFQTVFLIQVNTWSVNFKYRKFLIQKRGVSVLKVSRPWSGLRLVLGKGKKENSKLF